MNIRCPQCKRLFEYDPGSGPARCTYQDCGWTFGDSGERNDQGDSRPAEVGQQQTPVSLSDTETGTDIAAGSSPSHSVDRRAPSGMVGTIRCPSCRNRIPDDTNHCPYCEADVHEALSSQQGVRAVFDVSGDITFTPRMVAVLFVATLAAFLAFTWIISGNRGEPRYQPIVLTGQQSGDAGGEHISGLQGIEFEQLKREFLDPAATDLRRQALRERFGGERVIWNGIVTSVDNKDGGYLVEVAMGERGSNSYVSLNALAHEANESRIVQLRRGDQVMFSGKIAAFHTGGAYDPMDFFRVELSNGLLLN